MSPHFEEPVSRTEPSVQVNRSADMTQENAEPIAICGIALRLPGGVATPSQFWDLLVNKKDARGLVPETRFNVSSYYSKSGKPGRMKTQHGYFLDESVDVGALDTSFFRMPRSEVERVDPQQRLLLELTRECLESAGEIDYRGKLIGTYIGTFGEDWLESFAKDNEIVGQYKITGYGEFLLSNRISYEYDLKGPSMTIRTACSSALIGLHQACLSIRSGECSAALVGGSNLLLAPGTFVSMSEQGVLSPTGSCRTFDADADGYARAEAVNLVYIKKLSDALRDGNPIRAVIRGTSSNADGKTPSLTMPSYDSHEAMIRRAYEVAGISNIAETGFVECHGTGTATGDPIETKTIGTVFGDAGVFIGACKPNVGHSEGASGITSLIKGVLALEHRQIPPNIKFNKPNPEIPFKEKNLKVPLETTPWPEDRAERVSINSFGIGGANAHVILESAASFLGKRVDPSVHIASVADHLAHLVLYSANSTDSLRRQAVSTQKYIDGNPPSLPDVAYTLACRRMHLPNRAFSVFGDGIEPNVSPFAKVQPSAVDLVLVFTGQGAQWPCMGIELLKVNPVFAKSIDLMNSMLKGLKDGPSWTIVDELMRSDTESRVYEAAIAQPLCTAVQVALVDALRTPGIRPFAVVGHSSGEMAAAYTAGKITRQEAIIAAYYRGQVSTQATRPGSMGAVGMGWAETEAFLIPGVVIACENSPSSVTISGDKKQVKAVLANIKSTKPDVLARLLKVDKAYHSHHMQEVGDSYLQLTGNKIKSVEKSSVSSPIFFSTVTGNQVSVDDPTDARYWRSNLESPVLFSTAITNLVTYHKTQNANALAFLEVGPHSALNGPLRQILAQMGVSYQYASCLRRLEDARHTFLSSIGQLWQYGLSIDFTRLTNPKGIARVVPDLPSYPWQHDHSYLFASRTIREWRFRKFRKHELLGVKVPESSGREPVFRNVLAMTHVPWLRDHKIKGDVIFPCAGYIGMVGEAARQLCDGDFAGYAVRDVVIDMAMILNETTSVEIITSLRKEQLTDNLESSWWVFTISSYNGSTWAKHCAGQVRSLDTPRPRANHSQDHGNLVRNVNVPKWYQALRNVGANYGPCFQGLASISCSTTEHLAQGTALHTVSDDEEFYPIHPTKVDFFLQLFSVASSKGVGQNLEMTVPTSIGSLEIYTCSDEIKMSVDAIKTNRSLVCGGGAGFDNSGRLVMSMAAGKLSPLEADQVDQVTDPHAGARVVWQPDIDCITMSKLVISHEQQDKYLHLTQELNLFCIENALRKLEGIETTITHLQAFFRWMQKQPKPNPDFDAADLTRLIAGTAFAPCAIEMENVLEHIVSIFKGEVEPLEVLTLNNALVNLYDMLNLTNREKLFQVLGHSKPNMRILEIGAGTGGTTNKVLNWLKNPVAGATLYANYTYTDISGGFFAVAQKRFEAYPSIDFKTLDISKDPLEQGFEAESFDLILAANVLHATPSLSVTLSNVRKLLKPDGRLYMEELCCEVKPINFIMGILPGWWLGADDGRPDEPYISPSQWHITLEDAGFSGIEDFTFDCPQPNHLLAFMTARPQTVAIRPKDITLLCDEDSMKVQTELESLLVAQGYDVSVTSLEQGRFAEDRDVIALIDITKPFFEDIDHDTFASFQEMVKRLSNSKSGLFWVTRSSQVDCHDPRWAQTIGTSRCIRSELSMDFATCEVDSLSTPTLTSIVQTFEKFHARQENESVQPDFEYAIVNEVVYIPRLYPVNVIDEIAEHQSLDESESYDLTIGRYGRLNTLKWTERQESQLLKDEVAIEAKAVGVNFKDVLIAMGIVDSPQKALGLEAAGIVKAIGPDVRNLCPGDRVLVFGGGCFSTRIVITEKLCARIPSSLDFEDAATMPCVFSTVIYGLLDVGRLASGQSVLIHSACGGVGLAAIQICKMIGADIFCTVGNEEKAKYLEDTWGIPRHRVFNSRDLSFQDSVLKATGARGVDLVLNSLSGELLHASWNCVAEFGKMVELGKRDLIGNGKLALNIFELNRSYHGVDLGHLIDLKPAEGNRLLCKIVELLEQGHIRPIRPIKTFTADAAEECFRYMQKGQHMGKIVVSMNTPSMDLGIVRPTNGPVFRQDASYLVVGGLGGLGRLVSTWMVDHGARALIYLSRRAGESPEDRAFFRELESQGCAVTVVKGSVTIMSDVDRAIDLARQPIRGVFNMSMVLKDQGFTKMTYDEWMKAVQPKVQGTWNLHRACATNEIALDHFILFSSLSGIIGQRGQANYAGANTFLDAFVQYRHSLGEPAAVINIGALLDHGYVAESPELMEAMKSQGFYGIKTPQLLDAIAAVMHSRLSTEINPNIFVNPLQLVIGLRSVTPLSDPSNRVVWKHDRRMLIYFNNEPASAAAKDTSGTSSELISFISKARLEPSELKLPKSSVFLAQQIALQLYKLLLKPVDNTADIDVNLSLQDAGLDSLVAVEMRSWWKSVFPFDISVLEMLSMRTLLALGERAAQGLREQFEVKAENGVTDGEKHDTEKYIRTKMP